MAGIPHDHYEPGSKGEKWLHRRLPIVGFYMTIMLQLQKFELDVDLGCCSYICLALQIITGIVLAMHYTPHVDRLLLVSNTLRNVNGGHMLRYLHATVRLCFYCRVCSYFQALLWIL